jgi:hypothetical protein
MTTGTVKTQGTKLYFVDPSGPTLVALGAPTGISGLGGPADQIETTDLDAMVDKEYVRGLGNPGQLSVPFNLVPSNASQQALFDLKESGENVNWCMALSDGTAAPVLAGSSITPPAARTSFGFSAYISDVTIDAATNEIVRGTLTLQRSGPVTPTWKP